MKTAEHKGALWPGRRFGNELPQASNPGFVLVRALAFADWCCTKAVEFVRGIVEAELADAITES